MKALPQPKISQILRFRNQPALQTGGRNSTIKVLMIVKPVYMAMKSSRSSWNIDLACRTSNQLASPIEHQSNRVRAHMLSSPNPIGGKGRVKAYLTPLGMNSRIRNPRTALMITVDVPAFSHLLWLTYS